MVLFSLIGIKDTVALKNAIYKRTRENTYS
jgi:hypothetical protein